METETTTPTALSLKEKFDNIDFELKDKDGKYIIPENIRCEMEIIQEDTSDFTDEDVIPAWIKNFNWMYFKIKQEYPDAMKDYVAPEPEVIEEPELTEEAKKALEIANKYKKKS